MFFGRLELYSFDFLRLDELRPDPAVENSMLLTDSPSPDSPADDSNGILDGPATPFKDGPALGTRE